MRGQLHARRRHRIDDGAEAGERIDEGVDGAAALEVAGDRDLQILQVLVLLLQREQIAERLRRMLVAAVAAVDHRDRRKFGGEPHRAVARMADDDHVGVVRDHPHGVGEAFALGGRARGGIGAGDDVAAEPQHRAFEGEARARARLVEQRRQNVVGGDIGALADAIGEVGVGQFVEIGLGHLENLFDLRVGEIVDRNHMPGGRMRLGRHDLNPFAGALARAGRLRA